MATTPTCYLYLSFLLHFAGFGSLLAGYCTPYWTLIKLSTGDVCSLGIVVSCFKKGCEMLHVTEARTVFVIIFGMCTATVLLSLFIVQTFCLAICNTSCRMRNAGTGMSYLSFLIAMTLGATLALYQIDLKEEAKPDVMSMKIGWSRFSVIGSSGAFFLGALLNIADYVRRNRLHRLDIQKKAEMKSKMLATLEKNRAEQQARLRQAAANALKGKTNVASSSKSNGGDFKGKRMSLTVDAAVKMASAKNTLEKSLNSSGGSNPKTNRILVSEAPGKAWPRPSGGSVGSGSSKGVKTAERSSGYREKDNQQTRGRVDENTQSVDAFKKTKLTKTAHVDSLEGKQVLPRVEEEKSEICENNIRQKNMTDQPAVTRQVTKTAEADVKSKSYEAQRREIAESLTRPPDRAPKTENEPGNSSSKYVITPTKHNNDLKVKATEIPNAPSGRRHSAVGEALLSVGHLLDNTANIHISPIDESSPKTNRSSQEKYEKLPKSKRTGSIRSSQTSIDLPAERATELPPVSHRRQLTNDDSVETLRHGIRKQLTVDSDKDSIKYLNNEEVGKTKWNQTSIDKDKEESLKLSTKYDGDPSKKENTEASKLETQMSEEQIKRNQILENMSKKKEKRKKRITQ